MAELGQKSPELHHQVGINMVKNGVEIMLGLGGEEIESYIGRLEKGRGKHEIGKTVY